MVVVSSFDRHGNMLDHNARIVTAEVDAGAAAKGLENGMLKIPVSISTAAPAVRVRFVVRANGSGKMGAANYFLADGKTMADPTANKGSR